MVLRGESKSSERLSKEIKRKYMKQEPRAVLKIYHWGINKPSLYEDGGICEIYLKISMEVSAVFLF